MEVRLEQFTTTPLEGFEMGSTHDGDVVMRLIYREGGEQKVLSFAFSDDQLTQFLTQIRGALRLSRARRGKP
jgi:hypothetical protein